VNSHDRTLKQGSPPRPAGARPGRRDWKSFLTGLLRSGARPLRRSQADHWSFLFSQIAVYSFVVACVSGVFLVFFFKPSMTGVTYHGSYHELNGVRMSEAYKSTLDISFDVRGGLLMRQIHHWSALIFVAAVCLQLLRLFFTGAFRRPRWLNWLIWVTLLLLGMAEGWTGTILPDDMLSSGSLDVLRGVLESIPVAGTHLMLWVFGGDVPGHRIIPRLYWLHVLLPVAIAGLFVLRRWLARQHGHPRFPGAAAGSGRLGSLQSAPAAAGVAMFFATCGTLALLGTIAQASPIWLYGPYQPGSISAGAAPDWYMGFLDGALRIMPGWELNVAGHPLTLAVLVPGLIVPGAFFTLLAAYPLLESRLTGDRGVHHYLDRPRAAATRTAVGTAGITFYGLLWAASSNDQIAYQLHLDLYAVTWFFRIAVLAGPPLAYTLTQRICLGLTRREREETKHGRETGRIMMSPDGRFSETSEPTRPVRDDGPEPNLPSAGSTDDPIAATGVILSP
jgi:ubiquinol-cytochrome c reductase cytochrome b subunit